VTRRWLGLALLTEGRSDDLFLPEVVRRSAQEVCGAWAEVPSPLVVRTSTGPGRHHELIRALARQEGAFTVVVYHRDGKSHPEQEIKNLIVPFRESLLRDGREEPVVALVPVQETEAWALADADALRGVLGVNWSDHRMGRPRRIRELESDADPKATLRRLFEATTSWDVDFLARLGELVALDRLRELPSFRRWENDLAEALQTLPGFTKG
jgi:hypothetical protein